MTCVRRSTRESPFPMYAWNAKRGESQATLSGRTNARTNHSIKQGTSLISPAFSEVSVTGFGISELRSQISDPFERRLRYEVRNFPRCASPGESVTRRGGNLHCALVHS